MTEVQDKLVLEGSRVKVLTQARQIDAAREHGVVVDYLRFTLRADQLHTGNFIPADTGDQDLARLMASKFAMLLGFKLGMDRPGRDYYEFTTTIDNELGYEVASVSAGGEGQRGTVCFTLKGEGCTNAAKGWEQRVHAFFGPVMPKLTRIDLARDFYEGEVSMDEVVGAYAAHAFSYRNRFPSYTQYGCWMAFALDAEAPAQPVQCGPVTLLHGHSSTFQVGRRESGKGLPSL
ncbi:replication initiation factor domain-containing protein [uncultured Xylophilus sp.]|uniref:replication initiation factor domain-containing protein n=1 Tax=uncultured Xylophilus sp. TaxID=296832 RepID=UPI0025FF7374|nr:replication initiation factor domain-containing protein [uncultured Xylophilus sp.]